MSLLENVAVGPLVLEQVALNDFSIRALQLLTVLVLDLVLGKFITLSGAYHPALLFKYLTQQLAKKVNRRSARHQSIAGQLSLLLLLSLALGLSWLILSFAATPWFYELVLLWLIISGSSKFRQATTIRHSLSQGHKILAREQLQLLCIRETASLSALGIVKATIEALPQRLVLSYFNPILIFACLGIYPTILAATLGGIAQCWNPKLAQYRHFGRAAMRLNNIGSFVAKFLFSINIFLLFSTRISPKKIILQARQWHSLGNGLLLSTLAGLLNRSLGGAVKYQNIKIRLPSLGEAPQPTIENIDDTYRICQQASYSWILLLLLALATSLTISALH